MKKIRKAADRGQANFGWLDSRHTFSFGHYHDAENMGFGDLRVINEDRIQGGTGFDLHAHRDMEIISYVIDGALEHRDSMGTAAIIRPGEIQRMSAGSGIEHSEYNHLKDRSSHFLQIWILPNAKNYEPSYAQKSFAATLEKGKLVLVASQKGIDGSITLNQDVNLYLAKTQANFSQTLSVQKNRKIWIQIIRGEVTAAGETLTAGDGLAITEIPTIELQAQPASEFMVFDLP